MDIDDIILVVIYLAVAVFFVSIAINLSNDADASREAFKQDCIVKLKGEPIKINGGTVCKLPNGDILERN